MKKAKKALDALKFKRVAAANGGRGPGMMPKGYTAPVDVDPIDETIVETEEEPKEATPVDSVEGLEDVLKDGAFQGPPVDLALKRGDEKLPDIPKLKDQKVAKVSRAYTESDAFTIGKRDKVKRKLATKPSTGIVAQGYANRKVKEQPELEGKTITADKAKTLDDTKAAEEFDDVTANDVLEMAVGERTVDLRYDVNNDGKITSADALALTKDKALLQGIEDDRRKEQIAKRTGEEFDLEAPDVTAATRDEEQEEAALAPIGRKYDMDPKSLIPEVDADDILLSKSPKARRVIRDEIMEPSVPKEEASRIEEKIGFDAAQRRTVTGTAAKGKAAKMLSAVAPEVQRIAPAIAENPAEVEAQIDDEPVEVQAAVAALPEHALISVQMETLMGGIEDGEIPTWAKPAVAAVNQRMAKRGLEVSTIARDALFNAIITSTFPLAQGNAQALQERARQNLSNEQQANITQANLNMNRRLANLSNRQRAESETAQFAQQIEILNANFDQQARLETAKNQQQIRVQDLANRQEAARSSFQAQQQINAQELSNEQQIELAELQYMNATEKENMSAIQQQRLAEFQVSADFLSKNAAFKDSINRANLDAETKMQLAFLSSRDRAAGEQLSADQQRQLANLNAKLQTNLTSDKIAQTMGVAQLNVDQQRAVQNAATVAKIDLSKFTADQQAELANSKFMQTMTLTDFNARQQEAIQDATFIAQMDMAEASENGKLRITNAKNFLTMDMANLNNRQQSIILDQQLEQQRLLSDQAAENAAKQFNATSENQVNMYMRNLAQDMQKYNVSQQNAMNQFNVTEVNRKKAIDAQLGADISRFNAELYFKTQQYNEDNAFRREQWNASNKQAVEQANIEWRRSSNTIDTAAQNAANQRNSQMAFSITAAEQDFLWQSLRDDAAYLRQAYESDEMRKATLLATSLQNEAAAGKDGSATGNLLKFVADIFSRRASS